MAGYDITMRYLTDRHPEQWARWLLGRRPDTCQLLQTTLPQMEREADLLLQVTFAGRTLIQHTEFQTGYDPDMTRRMLFYHVGFLLQYRLPVHSTVVWLTDEGYREGAEPYLKTTVQGSVQLEFRYHEVHLWRLDPHVHLERIRQEGLWSLLPMVSLMGEAQQREVVEEAVSCATQLPAGEERTDLLAGLVILGSLRYNREWLYRLIEEGRLMESPVLQDFMERGARKAKQEGILQILNERFAAVPGDLSEQVGQLHDLDHLDRLHLEAIRCDSLEAFRQMLQEVTQEAD